MLERTLTHICPAYSDQCLQPPLYKQTIMVQFQRMSKNTTVTLWARLLKIHLGFSFLVFSKVTYSLTTSIITYFKKKKINYLLVHWYLSSVCCGHEEGRKGPQSKISKSNSGQSFLLWWTRSFNTGPTWYHLLNVFSIR